VSVWLAFGLLVVYRRAKSQDFLRALEAIPKDQREAFCRNSGYKDDELAQLLESHPRE
jgi:hypothetical protein